MGGLSAKSRQRQGQKLGYHLRLPPSRTPDAAIFADTGAEPKAVYEHLDWLRSGNVLPFPVEVVQFSDLADDIRKTAAGVKPVAGRANGYLAPPFYAVWTRVYAAPHQGRARSPRRR